MTDPQARAWLRVRFSKLGPIRFISHRDVARAWERAVRRAGVPIAWSEGFSPRPALSFGLALPTGCESVAEYLDLRLERLCDPGDAGRALGQVLPDGLGVLAVAPRDHGAPSLQQEVTSCCWKLEVKGVSGEELATLVERLLKAPSVPLARVRKGVESVEDVRPLVRALELCPPTERWDSAIPLAAETATRPRGLRPEELVAALGSHLEMGRACRIRQVIELDGTRQEPLDEQDGWPGPEGASLEGAL